MTQREWIVTAIASLLTVGISLGIYTSYEKSKLAISEAYSAKEHAMAQEHAKLAAESNDKLIDLQKIAIEHQKVADISQKQVASLKVERAELLRKLAEAPLPSDERDVIIAKDAEVIGALDKQVADQKVVIADQKLVIAQSVVSIAQWQAAFQDEQRSRVGLQVALDAQKALNKSEKWIYRAQGLAIGIGGGYIAGRLH